MKGGLRPFFGRLIPQWAVRRPAAADPAIHVHRGPARVFSRKEEAVAAIYGPG
ncbi:MAG: dihydroxy-acid dehydratase [Deltaproteobacteria bacterium]|nr:dihydroxy-acid dehydratase [Deltaproteobacteria bacterium]